MVDYEAKLREGVQKCFGLSRGTGDKNRHNDESMQGSEQGTFQLLNQYRASWALIRQWTVIILPLPVRRKHSPLSHDWWSIKRRA